MKGYENLARISEMSEKEMNKYLKYHHMHIEEVPPEAYAEEEPIESHIESTFSVSTTSVDDILGNIIDIDEGMTAQKHRHMLMCFNQVKTIEDLLGCMEQFSGAVSRYTMRIVLINTCIRLMSNDSEAGHETAEELLKIFYAA